LLAAVFSYDSKTLRWLLKHGGDVNGLYEGVPIFQVVMQEWYSKCFTADITSIVFVYYTKKCVRLFLNYGAKASTSDLSMAITMQDVDIVKWLNRAGVKADADSIRLAMVQSSPTSTTVLETILKDCPDIDSMFPAESPIIHAMKNALRHSRFVELLLRFGASPNCWTADGMHALEHAYSSRMHDIVLMLAIKGAKLSNEERGRLLSKHSQSSLEIIDEVRTFVFLRWASRHRRSTLRHLPSDVIMEIINKLLGMVVMSLHHRA